MAEAANPNSTTALLQWRLLPVWRPTTSRATLTVAHGGEAMLEGTGGFPVDAERHHDLNLDGPPPPAARVWLREAATRLASATDCPVRVTDAARLLEKEMREAFLRRWVDEAWSAMSIKNFLIHEKFWPRTRRPKT
jgi:hypothetical protein